MPPVRQQCRRFAASGACTFGDKCRFQHDITIQTEIRTHTSHPPSSSAPTKKSSRSRKRTKRRSHNVQIIPTSNPLQEFFSEFSLFTYNPSAPATEEFHRLGQVYHWEFGSQVKKDARERFKDAMVKEFNTIYGTDQNDINAWHALCRVLDILPLPETLELCKKKVKSTYVNLVDLVDNRKSGGAVETFPTELALSEYTQETHKIFPRENAHAGGLLRYLLRQIENPQLPSSRTNRRRKPQTST